MVDEDKGLTIADVLTIARLSFSRYWRFALIPAVSVFVLGTAVAFRLPNYYESHAKIYIQPQRLSSSILETKEQKDDMNERLEALVQEILSRSRLRNIIDQFQLYPEYRLGEVGKAKAILQLREDILIDPVKSVSGKEMPQTFNLSYSNTNAMLAFQVTKALAVLFIEESNISRQSEVQGTEEFLEAQLAEARKKLESTEKKVQEFVSANFGRLPEHLDQAVARLQNYQTQLSTNSQLLSANIERRSHLQEEMGLASRRASENRSLDASSPTAGLTGDPRQNLAQLEASLTILLSKYSERHPDVIATRQRISLLRSQIASSKGTGRSTRGTPTSFAYDQETRTLRMQLSEVDIEIARMTKENEALRANISKLEKDIESMPEQEQQLVKINRDYANVKESYEKLLKARDDASLQSSLVRSQKNAQFRIVEDPEVPVLPAGPNRWLIFGGSTGGALASFFLLPFACFFLNGAYKFRNEIERDLGIEVVGLVPPMKTPESHAEERWSYVITAVLLILILAVGLVMVVFFL